MVRKGLPCPVFGDGRLERRARLTDPMDVVIRSLVSYDEAQGNLAGVLGTLSHQLASPDGYARAKLERPPCCKRKLWSPRRTLKSSAKNVTRLPSDIWGSSLVGISLAVTDFGGSLDATVLNGRGPPKRTEPHPPDRLLRRVDDAPHRQHGSARPTVEGLQNVNATTFC